MGNKEADKVILNIQRYSLHDGSGLRTTVFLKGCPLKCSWCSNPESQKYTSELSWDSSLCIGCTDCTAVFPDGPMQLQGTEIRFLPEQQGNPESYRDLCPAMALQVIGKKQSASEIVEEVLKDRVFYTGGGGVTLSGGEPLMQSRICREIALEVKKQNIHLSIETCLHVPWENIEKLLTLTDEFLCDVKHMNPEIFARQTGGDLNLILENLKRLSRTGTPIRARIPVIEGFNHNRETIRAILNFISRLDSVYAVDFMAYHPLGAGKYRNLKREYNHPETAMPAEELEPYVRMAEERDLIVTTGG